MSDSQIISHASDLLHTFKTALQNGLSSAQIPLTPTELKVLRTARDITPCTPQRLVNKLNRDKAQITRMLTVLEKKGYIARERNPDDKRSQLIKLTSTANDLLAQSLAPEKEIVERMVSELTQTELDLCLKTLDKMRGNLRK